MHRDPFPLVLVRAGVAFAGDDGGALRGGDHGLIAHDARWLRRWRWRWPDDLHELRLDAPGPDTVRQRLARIEAGAGELGRSGPRDTATVDRVLRLVHDGLDERIEVRAAAGVPADVTCDVAFDATVEDLFEVRGFAAAVPRRCTGRAAPDAASITFVAPDGVEDRVHVRARPEAGPGGGVRAEVRTDGVTLRFRVPAGERRAATVQVRLERHDPRAGEAGRPPARLADLADLSGAPPGRGAGGASDGGTAGPRPASDPGFPSPGAWRAELLADLPPGALDARDADVAVRAADDLHALLLPTPYGPFPAAGAPWYVAPFGRDALLACLLAPGARTAARATLRLLAALQGRRSDPATGEAPGKMPHEMRVGAVTRAGLSPHGPHYGTVDATPLWVMLLHRRWRAGEDELARELAPALRAALEWMRAAGADDPDGLLRFRTGEGGYDVQSWKDAGDSLTHADGRLARGAVAVVEVQGYAEAAWRGAAELLTALGDADGAADARARAARLSTALETRFFLPDLGPAGLHALALDGDDAPLAVRASDAGHLLWTGSVPVAHARAVAAALLEPAAFSGWGVRTLASDEARYAAVSYHTGSVWPHDTALFAVGLARYGMAEEARRVARAVLDLAAARPDRRAPELIAGDARDDGPPVAYPDACRVQAWDAAAVLAAARIVAGVGDEDA